MAEHRAQTGVCILRIETEIDRLLITVTTENHRYRGAREAGDPRVRRFADPELALEAVAEFVRSYRPTGADNS